MKKLLLFAFLSLSGMLANAQIVNIPDANFKNLLLNAGTENFYGVAKNNLDVPIVIDVNNDGQIQNTEAASVWSLSLFYNQNIASMEGIEAFINLRLLDCSITNITSLDVTGLTNLKELDCSLAHITSLNVSGLNNLERLDCSGCYLVQLDVSGLPNLKYLDCMNNYNPIAAEVTYLTSVNLSNLPNLEHFNAMGNKIADIDISNLPKLKVFDVTQNVIASSLDFSGSPLLERMGLDFNKIPSVNIINNENLVYAYLSENELDELIVGEKPFLNTLMCGDNNLTTIDISGCPVLQDFHCAWNQIDYINLKNGNTTLNSFICMSDTIDHIYLCVDEGEETFINAHLADFGLTTTELLMSTYCTFLPGGDYNTVSGVLRFDGDNNGCDDDDTLMPYVKVRISDSTGVLGDLFSVTSGDYRFYTQASTYTLMPQFENNWFTVTPPSATISFSDVNNNITTQNFCVTANGTHPDVTTVIVPIGMAQPGFDAMYKVVLNNKGNQVLSGQLTFTYNDDVLDYVTSSPSETSSGTGSLTWSYDGLQPFESREIVVVFNVNGPMETPPVNLDDVLAFTATATPTSGDETPADNTFELNQIVVGSFDPNDITCLEGDVVLYPLFTPVYLHYNINFENTGTAPATFIVVKDIINEAEFDVSSLQVISASHNVETRVTGNKVEFIFNNINLAGGGKGNVVFKIKTLNTLVVTQKADIYFDYNWPIETNDATTVFAVLNNDSFQKDASVMVYPNPAVSVLNLTAASEIQSIQLYDAQGRILETRVSVNETSVTLDVSNRAAGLYFVKVITEQGSKVEKILKK